MRIQEVFNTRLKTVQELLKKHWLVVVGAVVLVIAGCAGGYFYWMTEQTKKQEAIQRQKIARENQAKTTYSNDFAKAFSGLNWEGLSAFYDRFWQDRMFFDSKNWELNSLKCTQNCNLTFSKGEGDVFSLVELRLNGKSVKPQFDQKKLEFVGLNYFGDNRQQFYPELTTDSSFDKSLVFSDCTSRLVDLYNLSDSLQGFASSKVGLPKPVTSINGYHWVMHNDTKYGVLTLENIDPAAMGLLKDVLRPDTVLTDVTLTPESVDVKINYFCI